jgi:hypothetical protein
MNALLTPAQNPIGDFTASTLIADPETGFLGTALEPQVKTASGFGPRAVFTVAKKLTALNMLRDLWPDVPKVCEAIGISRWTWKNHLLVDESWRECVEDIQEKCVARIERVRMAVAQTPGGSFDRMCVLNAYRRELYNPKQVIEVQHSLTVEQTQQQRARMESAIDAEVVETVRRVKAARKKA